MVPQEDLPVLLHRNLFLIQSAIHPILKDMIRIAEQLMQNVTIVNRWDLLKSVVKRLGISPRNSIVLEKNTYSSDTRK